MKNDYQLFKPFKLGHSLVIVIPKKIVDDYMIDSETRFMILPELDKKTNRIILTYASFIDDDK